MDEHNFKVSIIDALRNTFAFNSSSAFIAFAQNEMSFWGGEAKEVLATLGQTNRPSGFARAVSTADMFSKAVARVETLRASETFDDAAMIEAVNHINSELSKLARLSWIHSGNPISELWVKSYRSSIQAGNSFYESLVGGAAGNVPFETFKGYVMAYEADQQDESNIPQRRAAEVKTFKRERARLIAKTDEIYAEADHSAQEYKKWFKAVVEENNAETVARHGSWSKELEQYQTAHKESLAGCQLHLDEMANLLTEQLRMKGPASYWKKSASKYRCQGIMWTIALISWAALALVYFREFFLAWANGDRMALNLASLEGAVIFAAIISSFIFMSRVFSRLAFSSFHLQRDAEEREQLTHLYLALSHDLSVDDETRKIVLQSLFSRTETGLLANESGPTMPGVQDVVSSVIRRN